MTELDLEVFSLSDAIDEVNYPTLKKLSDNSISRQKQVKKKADKAFKSKKKEFSYY